MLNQRYKQRYELIRHVVFQHLSHVQQQMKRIKDFPSIYVHINYGNDHKTAYS